jgi:hypothetical protein
MEKLINAVTGRRRFPAYSSLLVDRTGNDDDDTEIVIDAHEQQRNDIQERVRRLATRLERSPSNVNGSDALLNWPRLARFAAERMRANFSAHFLIAHQLDRAYRQFNGAYHDQEDSDAPLPAFVAEDAPGIYLVDLLALFEMLCHGLAHQPEDTDVTLKHFLRCYGEACQYEHAITTERAGLFSPGAENATRRCHHCVVLVHQESAFYDYLRGIVPSGFLDKTGEEDTSPGFASLQVVPLPVAIAHVLTGRTAADRVSDATYDVIPLWPYFAWKKSQQ